MVVNIPKNYHEDELTNDYLIRRHAVDHGIPLITNIQLAQRFVEAIFEKTSQERSSIYHRSVAVLRFHLYHFTTLANLQSKDSVSLPITSWPLWA